MYVSTPPVFMHSLPERTRSYPDGCHAFIYSDIQSPPDDMMISDSSRHVYHVLGATYTYAAGSLDDILSYRPHMCIRSQNVLDPTQMDETPSNIQIFKCTMACR